MTTFPHVCGMEGFDRMRGDICLGCNEAAGEPTGPVDKVVQESIEFMARVNHMTGKIQSALAIADGPHFGESDGDMDDVRMILRAALEPGPE